MMRQRFRVSAACVLAFAWLASPAPAPAQTAQPPAPAPEAQEPPPRLSLVPPGTIMGPGMMRRGAIGRLCDPRGLGLAGWRIQRLERALELTDEQKKKLQDVRTASERAVEQFIADCPRGALPLTPTGRLELMEKRLAAMLEAVRTLRVAFDPFYAALTDEQKARLTPNDEGSWRFEGRDERRRGRRERGSGWR